MDIGIIGGADGPTAIYLASGGAFFETILAVAVLAAAAIILFRVMRKRKNKSKNK